MKHTQLYTDGVLTEEKFYNNNGQLHNDNGPAVTRWYNDGKIDRQEYHINGQLHNKNGAAFFEWYNNGQMSFEVFYVNGKYCDGKAVTFWHSNGQVAGEMYFLDDMRHNHNGPAVISYDESGKIIEEEYFLVGYEFEKEDWERERKRYISPNVESPRASVEEARCPHCGKMNDVGVEQCWMCESKLG